MTIKQIITRTCAPLSIVSLLLYTAMLTGCASSKDYPGPTHGLTFNGTIKSVDLKEQRLTLTPLKPGDPVVFVWNNRTKFWKQGEPIKADVLEPTWPVRVHYHTDSGQLTAHHIYVELTYPIIH